MIAKVTILLGIKVTFWLKGASQLSRQKPSVERRYVQEYDDE